MKFKLDENIGNRGKVLLESAGHDVSTVASQKLCGAQDEVLFAVCAAEGRALITLDHDFSQVLRFPPAKSAGLVILELPTRADPDSILIRLREFLAVLQVQPLGSALWIVEPGRVRVHQADDDDLGEEAPP